jgi:hypothetical protein
MILTIRKPRIRGVALIISNPSDEILIIKEEQSKPHFGKYRGMFSPPMETARSGEQDCSTIARLIDEELPGFAGRILLENKRRGVYRIVPGVWVRLYAGRTQDSLLPTPTTKSKKEIAGYAWIPPQSALALWIRQGAREMLADYIEDRRGVICRHCRPAIAPRLSASK